MKTLLFSLLFIGGILPNVVFAITAQDIINEADRLEQFYAEDAKPPSITEESTTTPTQPPTERSPIKTEEEMQAQSRNDKASLGLTEAQRIESRTGINPSTAQLRTTESTQTTQYSKTPTNISILDQIAPSENFAGKFGAQPLSKILNQLFWIGLVGAVVLALVMVIRGGIEYMTIDSISGKESGKNRIQAALGGLLLAFSAILILNTINPGLTKLSIVFKELKTINPVDFTGVITSGARTGDGFGGNGYSTINNAIIPTGNGYEVTPGRVAIDTDGSQRPPFNDPDWQNQTSLAGLNANTDNYVVVPIGSNIPLGTRVQMYNENTGKTAWGIVGDRGPSPNGYGELSLNAARELGAWTDGMGNSANQHKIKYTYYTNEKK